MNQKAHEILLAWLLRGDGTPEERQKALEEVPTGEWEQLQDDAELMMDAAEAINDVSDELGPELTRVREVRELLDAETERRLAGRPASDSV